MLLADVDGRRSTASCTPRDGPRPAPAERPPKSTPWSPPDSDLPAAIGKPATRALLGLGITTLGDFARNHEADLRAIHGVGPKLS